MRASATTVAGGLDAEHATGRLASSRHEQDPACAPEGRLHK
jgi:hypothetical protein